MSGGHIAVACVVTPRHPLRRARPYGGAVSVRTAASLVDGALDEEGVGEAVRVLGPALAEAPVSAARVERFCDQLGDGSARYREDGEAPPALLPAWRGAAGGEPGERVTSVVTDLELLRPVSVGDLLQYWDEVLRVSPVTAVGDLRGRFVTTRTTFAVDGDLVGTRREVTFCHQ